jgi:hypothetical protein
MNFLHRSSLSKIPPTVLLAVYGFQSTYLRQEFQFTFRFQSGCLEYFLGKIFLHKKTRDFHQVSAFNFQKLAFLCFCLFLNDVLPFRVSSVHLFLGGGGGGLLVTLIIFHCPANVEKLLFRAAVRGLLSKNTR